MKQCTKCKQLKEVTEFGKQNRNKNGLQPKCKACDKQYRQENSARILEYKKQYYLDNLEKIKQYRDNNAEAVSERQKQWREKNAEYRKQYIKQYYESLKDGYHHVYILPDHHYAGTTECIPNRMHNHKSAGRNTDNYEIVGVYENREDALAHEQRLHNSGYNGKHINNSYK